MLGNPRCFLATRLLPKQQGVDGTKLHGWRYVQRVIGKDVIIAGNDHPANGEPENTRRPNWDRVGTAKGVADFLRQFAGVRFLYPDIPPSNAVNAAAKIDLLASPAIEFLPMKTIAVPSDLSVQKTPLLRVNTAHPADGGFYDLARNRFPRVDEVFGGHTWERAVPLRQFSFGRSRSECLELQRGVCCNAPTMTTFKIPPATVPVALAAIFALSFSTRAFSEPKSPEDAQALLHDVKKRDLERKLAAKQTEVNRLNEDVSKGRDESKDLNRNIAEMGIAITETTGQLDQLAAERTRLTQALEVTNMRLDAEKLKLTGLKMLSAAQGKVLTSLSNRNEDTELKAAVSEAELKLMSGESRPNQADAGIAENISKLRTQIAELKKKRAKFEPTVKDAGTAARDAMEAATAKLSLADTASAKAKKKADEFGLAEVADGPHQKAAITAPRAIEVR